MPERILITGGSGHIGSNLVVKALTNGYEVNVPIRSQQKVDKLKKIFGHEDRVRYFIVPDIQASGAYDEAVKGVDYIFLVASPVPQEGSTEWRKEYIDPAVNGTKRVLESAMKEQKIKRAIFLGSICTYMPLDYAGLPDDRRIFEDQEVKITADPDREYYYPFAAYHGSKILTYQAIDQFKAEKKPAFPILSVHPDYVYGINPVQEKPDEISSAAGHFWREFSGVNQLLRFQEIDHSVHMEDVTDAHFILLDPKHKDGAHYILSAGEFKWDDVLAYAQKTYPEQGFSFAPIPPEKEPFKATYVRPDGSKAAKELGIKYKDIYQQFKDIADNQIRLAGQAT